MRIVSCNTTFIDEDLSHSRPSTLQKQSQAGNNRLMGIRKREKVTNKNGQQNSPSKRLTPYIFHLSLLSIHSGQCFIMCKVLGIISHQSLQNIHGLAEPFCSTEKNGLEIEITEVKRWQKRSHKRQKHQAEGRGIQAGWIMGDNTPL